MKKYSKNLINSFARGCNNYTKMTDQQRQAVRETLVSVFEDANDIESLIYKTCQKKKNDKIYLDDLEKIYDSLAYEYTGCLFTNPELKDKIIQDIIQGYTTYDLIMFRKIRERKQENELQRNLINNDVIGAFQCEVCESYNTRYKVDFTRSTDEAQTVSIVCGDCYHIKKIDD